MNGKQTEKRVLKGYKVRDSQYQKALKKSKKVYGISLAELLEDVVEAVANNIKIQIGEND